MKKLIMVLGLALASSVVVVHAEGGPQGGDQGPAVERMQDKLGLTDEQIKKMRDIRDAGGSRQEMHAVLTPEQQAKAAELRKAHEGVRAERKAHMQEYLGLSDEQTAKIEQIRKSGGTREDMRAVLTPEQLTKLEAKHSELQQRRMQRTEGQGSAPAGVEPKPE